MRGIIINHGTEYIENLKSVFPDCDILDYTKFDKSIVDKYDFIILSGGGIEISDDVDLKDEKKYLRNTEKPILGICLGHQILAIIFGSKLKGFEIRRVGDYHTKLFNKELDLYYNHQFYIDKLGDEFDKEYEEYENKKIITYFKHKTKKIMGIQSHPEKSKDGKEIIKFFLSQF